MEYFKPRNSCRNAEEFEGLHLCSFIGAYGTVALGVGGGMLLSAAMSGGSSPSIPGADPNIGLSQAKMAELADKQFEYNKTRDAANDVRQAKLDATGQQYVDAATTLQKQNAHYSQDYYNRMQNTFYPVEDSLVANANAAGGAADQQQQMSLAQGQVQQSFANQTGQMARMAQSYGLDPTSGRYTGAMAANATNQAATEAAAMNQARQAAIQLGWSKKMDAASLGRGLPSAQATAAGTSMNAMGAGLNAAGSGNAFALGSQGAMNQGFGGAVQGYQGVGSLGIGTYQTATQGWGKQLDANAQQQAGMGQFLGTMGSAGLKYMAMA